MTQIKLSLNPSCFDAWPIYRHWRPCSFSSCYVVTETNHKETTSGTSGWHHDLQVKRSCLNFSVCLLFFFLQCMSSLLRSEPLLCCINWKPVQVSGPVCALANKNSCWDFFCAFKLCRWCASCLGLIYKWCLCIVWSTRESVGAYLKHGVKICVSSLQRLTELKPPRIF